MSTNVKLYGENTIEIDTKRLQQDINSGKIKNVEIVLPQRVQSELRNEIDKAQNRYDMHPSPRNEMRLERAKQDLENAIRDNECLLMGCISREYIKGGE